MRERDTGEGSDDTLPVLSTSYQSMKGYNEEMADDR